MWLIGNCLCRTRSNYATSWQDRVCSMPNAVSPMDVFSELSVDHDAGGNASSRAERRVADPKEVHEDRLVRTNLELAGQGRLGVCRSGVRMSDSFLWTLTWFIVPPSMPRRKPYNGYAHFVVRHCARIRVTELRPVHHLLAIHLAAISCAPARIGVHWPAWADL